LLKYFAIGYLDDLKILMEWFNNVVVLDGDFLSSDNPVLFLYYEKNPIIVFPLKRDKCYILSKRDLILENNDKMKEFINQNIFD